MTVITEDQVKRSLEKWLTDQGYRKVATKMGRRNGNDVEGIDPEQNRLLVVECKGEASVGDQHKRSWPNVASAVLTALNELESRSGNIVGLAFPDTDIYRSRLSGIQAFLSRNGIRIYFVSEDGSVDSC